MHWNILDSFPRSPVTNGNILLSSTAHCMEKNSIRAAKNVLDDFEATIQSLKRVAGSLKLCGNPRLKELGYRRINFLSHRYFMMYRIVKDIVFCLF